MEPPVSDEHGGTVTMGGERQGEEEIPCAHRIIPTGDSCQSASAKVPGLLRAGRSGHRNNPRIGVIPVRAIHLSRLHWCDALPRLAGWCPVPAFARRVPVMVRHGRGLLGLSGVASLAGRVRLPTM